MMDVGEDLNAAVFQDYREMFSPALLGEIYREFLSNTRERLHGLAGSSPELARAAAHTIAGTAGMLGAGRIARDASRIEHGNAAPRPAEIEQMLEDCALLEAVLRERQVSL